MYLRILVAILIIAGLMLIHIAYAASDITTQERAKQEAKHKKEELKTVNTKKDKKDNKIDLNTASKEELKEIKGVGDVLADAIIKGRPYKSWDDVSKVKGIGDAKLKTLKEGAKL